MDQLDPEMTPAEFLDFKYPGHEYPEIRRQLGAFHVSGDLATKKIKLLSGGQKARVAFAMVTWNQPHLIVMDEPTNHLDTQSIEGLIDALQEFKGGVIVISHDIYFIQNVVKQGQFYSLKNSKLRNFDTYEDARDAIYSELKLKDRH